MAFRVVHSGTGMIGRAALDGILNHPELELVGMYAQSPEKIGADVGMFIGIMIIFATLGTMNYAGVFQGIADGKLAGG